jgi:glycosyltransferase involved in cell wall biosynthesis
VGHLVEQKDPVAAVDGFARLVDRGSDAHLVVVGSGPLAGEVRSAIHRRGLTERTTLLGHVDQVERILGGIDLLWLTSRDEGIPGVLVEAAMAGCPVVTYPVGDVAEVVEHDVTGVVLRAGDPNVLADVTVDLLADRQRLVTMGQRARSESSRWSMDVVVNDYLEVFEAVTGSRQAGSGAAE